MKAKKVLRAALVVESIVLILVLFFSDRGCTTVCFDGVNNAVLYVLPVIGTTLFAYAYIKINELMSKKTNLGYDHRMVTIFVPVIVFILVIFAIYYFANT